MKVVLMGTTDFAVPALNRLVENGFEVVAAVCQPDRPNQRGKKIRYLPVKQRAIELDIPVFQPERVKTEEAVATLKSYNADVFVVAAYGQILSEEILNIPPMGCVNIHGSLLPAYRGAAPIHHAVIDGLDETGITIMQMDIGMDTGDMIAKASVPITQTTTVGELHDELAELGAVTLIKTLKEMAEGTAVREKQNDEIATYADKVDRNTGRINWDENSFKVIRRINGTDPFPGAWSLADDVVMKCFKPVELKDNSDVQPGTVLKADTKAGLIVKTADGAVEITEIQMPGKKRMAARDYFKGNSLETGMILK